MTQLTFANDFVQLPIDSTGKKSAFLRWDTGLGNYLYIPAGVVSGVDGTIAEVKGATPGTSDNGLVVRTAGVASVGGNVASGATDSGNPVKIGVVALNTAVLVSDGTRNDLTVDSRGRLRAHVGNTSTGTDNQSNTLFGFFAESVASPTILIGSASYGFNGTSWDRVRTVNTGQLRVTPYSGTSRGDGEADALGVMNGAASLEGIAATALYGYSGSGWDRLRLSGAAAASRGLQVTGNVSSGSSDSGNPVKVGGVYNTSLPVVTAGQRVDLQQTQRGALIAQLYGGVSAIDTLSVLSDGIGITNVILGTYNFNLLASTSNWARMRDASLLGDAVAGTGVPAAGLIGFNGSTWDRVRVANTGRLQVDVVTAPSTAVTNAGTFAVQATLAAETTKVIGTVNQGTSPWLVSGDVASGATDSGNPVKIAGVYNSTPPTFTTGQRGDLQLDSKGTLKVALVSTTATVLALTTTTPSTDTNAVQSGLNVVPWNMMWNPSTSTWERERTMGGADGAAITGISANGIYAYNGTTYDRMRGNTLGVFVQGDAAGLGNPLKFGAIYNSVLPTVLDGARQELQIDSSARLRVVVENSTVTLSAETTKVIGAVNQGTSPWIISGSVTQASGPWTVDTELPAAAVLADAVANPTIPMVASPLLGFNGTTWDRGRTIDAFKTASATPDVGILASIPTDRRFTAVTLATAANSVQSWDVNGASEAIITVGTTTTGTFIFEVSNDGTNWQTAEVYDGGVELWVPGAVTPTSGKNYRIITHNWRTLRARTVTTLGATVSLTATLSTGSAIIRAIDVGPAPHAYGETELNATAQFTAITTSTTVGPTVAATQRMVVTYFQIMAGGTVAGAVQLYFGTGAYARGTSRAIFDGEFAPSATIKTFVGQAKPNGWIGALDEEVRITSVAAISPLTVSIWYYLIG